MWSDDLDNKMKEATEAYHPAYEDKAWDKMEVLLDKHLPLEKKRRRFIFLLLPLLLVGTVIFFINQKTGNRVTGEENNTVIKSESMITQPGEKANIETIPSKTPASKQATASATIQQDVITPSSAESKPTKIKIQKQLVVSGDINNNRKKVKKIISRQQQFEQQESVKQENYNHKIKDQQNNFTDQNLPEQNALVIANDKISVNNNNDVLLPVSGDTSASLTEIAKAVEDKKQSDSSGIKIATAETKPKKQRVSTASKFSLSFSAGPDISSIGIDNPGKWKLQYGIGLSYAVSKKLSIRTGFFAGHKKYSADSTEYHSTYYHRLQKIEADCLVFEVPVNLIYNFSINRKRNWFVAGGMSSYFMKKEEYGYYYKDSMWQQQFSSYTFNNKNSHIFSVINLSGGYQYHFTDRLSLMAEPYVRIPVSGIGNGKVKLNSAGVLFSLGFKPFLKKN